MKLSNTKYLFEMVGHLSVCCLVNRVAEKLNVFPNMPPKSVFENILGRY